MKILSVLLLSVVSALSPGYSVSEQPSTEPRCTAREPSELYTPYGAPVPGAPEECWSNYITKVVLSEGWYRDCVANANGRCDRIAACEATYIRAMQKHDEVYELCVENQPNVWRQPGTGPSDDCPMRDAEKVYPPFGAPVPGTPLSCWWTYQALFHQFEYEYLECVAAIPYVRSDPRYCTALKNCENEYISKMKAADAWYAECISGFPNGN